MSLTPSCASRRTSSAGQVLVTAITVTSSGRPPEDVTVIAVTKTWPAEDVRLLAQLGVRDMGENRDQEAAAKATALADLPISWHFVGQVQTNKAASVASYAHFVDA